MIPKIIHQTYHQKTKIPMKVYDNINKYASNYEHKIYDDNDCIKIIEDNFPKYYVDVFKRMKLGAHKADLFRYCILFLYGGIYLDIKTQLIEPIPEFETGLHVCIGLDRKHVYNGIIIAPPGHKIFINLIEYSIKYYRKINNNYHMNCKYMLDNINEDLKNTIESTSQKKYYSNKYLYPYYVYDEVNSIICEDKKDRYNLCTFIIDREDGHKVFKVRYHDFPW